MRKCLMGKEITDEILEESHFDERIIDLDLSANKIRRCECRFPSTLIILNLSSNRIQTIEQINFPESLIKLYLASNYIQNIEHVRFPTRLQLLDLSNNQINSIEHVEFPLKLLKLYLSHNLIPNVVNVNFPDSLRYLYLNDNPIKDLEHACFPKELESLNLNHVPIKSLTSWMPNKLQVLHIAQTDIEILENVRFPSSLQFLAISGDFFKLMKNIRFPNSFIQLHLDYYSTIAFHNCWISPSAYIWASDITIKSIRESTKHVAANRIQRCYRKHLIRCHRAAFVIQRWYIACSYRRGGVAFLNAENQYPG